MTVVLLSHAKDRYYYVSTAECEIPVPSYLEKIRYDKYLANEEANEPWLLYSSLTFYDKNTTSSETLEKLIKQFRTEMNHTVTTPVYTVHYSDEARNRYDAKENKTKFGDLRGYLILFDKTIIHGETIHKDDILYIADYCSRHKK